MRRLPFLLTALGLLSVYSALIGHAFGMRTYFLLGLWSATILYLLVALSNGAHRSRAGWLILLGLAACAMGDFLGPGNFEAGVAAFALAHLIFSVCFISLGLSTARFPLTLMVAAAASALVIYWLQPHLEPGEPALVWGYAIVIGAMITTALSLQKQEAAPLIMGAAMIFYVSDLFVARWRFVDGSSMNAYLCYPLYYTACLMFAWVPRCLNVRHKASLHTGVRATSS